MSNVKISLHIDDGRLGGGKIFQLTVVIIITIIITSGCIFVDKKNTDNKESTKQEEQILMETGIFPPNGWSKCTKIVFTLDIHYCFNIDNITPTYSGKLYITNDESDLYIGIILENEDYNSIGINGFSGIGDAFRIYIDCFNESYPYCYRYEDVKVLYVGRPDDCAREPKGYVPSINGFIRDEQYLSLNKYVEEKYQERILANYSEDDNEQGKGNGTPQGSGNGTGISASFGLFGISDYIYNGTINFNASYSHTNPTENATGDYVVVFSIPLNGESFEGFPIDLITNINNTLNLKFLFIDAQIAGLGEYQWSYTLI